MFKKLNRSWYRSLEKLVRQQGKRVRSAARKSASVARPARSAASSGNAAGQPPDPPGTWNSGIFRTAALGRSLRYRLFLPPATAGNAGGAALLIMLHGCQQDAEQFAAGTGMNRLAGSRGYAVLYPEQSPAAHPQRCWKWYQPSMQRGDGDIALIAGLADELATTHGIDRRRVYACGISAGAAMAHILALTHPGLVAAVGLHSGPVFGACRSAAGAVKVMQQGGTHVEAAIDEVLHAHPPRMPMPAILITGSRDHVVRPINARQLERQFLHLNRQWPLVQRALVEKEFGRTSPATGRKRKMLVRDYLSGRKPLLRAIEIEGLGHAWSGGDDSVPFHAKGPNATRLMLDFFERHRRGQG